MKKILFKLLVILTACYLIICTLLYLYQEKLIFFPQKLISSYQFDFNGDFEELNYPVAEGTTVNGLLFHTDSTKGLVFYLHGNAGSLASWGQVAAAYTQHNYDVFIMDYRGYGKSSGSIISQEQLYQDNQFVYNELLQRYAEKNTIILGYSIGTGMAAKLAKDNNPKHLILQAPYYSLQDMMRHNYPIIPTFLLKYKFATNEHLKDCDMPITIFHGTQDQVIYYGSSKKLKSDYPEKINFITLKDQGHNGITDNLDYQNKIDSLLFN